VHYIFLPIVMTYTSNLDHNGQYLEREKDYTQIFMILFGVSLSIKFQDVHQSLLKR